MRQRHQCAVLHGALLSPSPRLSLGPFTFRGCFPGLGCCSTSHTRARERTLARTQCVAARAKAKACPEPGRSWQPPPEHGLSNNLSSLDSTGKSRLRVLKFPFSQTKPIMGHPREGGIRVRSVWEREQGPAITPSPPPFPGATGRASCHPALLLAA